MSDFLNSLHETEVYYSSDSDCEYHIAIKVLKTEKSQAEYDKSKRKLIIHDIRTIQNRRKDNPRCQSEPAVLEEKLKCCYCLQNFTTHKNLKQHTKMYHVQESGIIDLDLTHMSKCVCPECNKQLKDVRCLKKHLKLCHNLIIHGLVYNGSHRSRASISPIVVKNDLSEKFPIVRDRSPNSGKARTKCGICGHGPVYGYTTIIKHQVI